MSECTKQSFGEASSRSIQRYDAVRNEHDVEHSETGEYVKYEVVENLQARIAELEKAIAICELVDGKTFNESISSIKAQGIREMLEFYRDCQPPDSTINSLTFEMIQVYADELASDNEALEDKNGI